MHAPFSHQARFGATPLTQPPRRVPPSAPGCSNIFTTLSLASAFASTTVSAPHAAISAFPQPTPGLLPPPVGPGAPIPLDRFTRDSTFTGQYSDAFSSWSQPASVTGRSTWTEGPDFSSTRAPRRMEAFRPQTPRIQARQPQAPRIKCLRMPSCNNQVPTTILLRRRPVLS